ESGIAGEEARKQRREFLVAQKFVGVALSSRPVSIRRGQVIELLSAIFSGSRHDRLVVKLLRDGTVNTVLFSQNAIGSGKQIIVLAVDLVVQVLIFQRIPKIIMRHRRGFGAEWIALPSLCLTQIPQPLNKRTRVAAGCVVVAEYTDFTIDEKIIERNEFARQLVMHRRDVISKKSQFGIAVAPA